MYEFDPQSLSAAHENTRYRCNLALCDPNVDAIIIDNTNTQWWEFRDYVEMGQRAGYQIELQEPKTSWWINRDIEEMARRGTHNVTLDTITRMVQRFETIDPVILQK